MEHKTRGFQSAGLFKIVQAACQRTMNLQQTPLSLWSSKNCVIKLRLNTEQVKAGRMKKKKKERKTRISTIAFVILIKLYYGKFFDEMAARVLL